jgi:hypothetical protein
MSGKVIAQLPAAHRPHPDPVLGLHLLRQLPDHGQHLLAVGHLEFPHQQVHRLAHPRLLHALLVVGRVPGLLDHRPQLEALDQDAALFVHRKVGRAHHPLHAPRAQPRLGGREQRVEDLLIVLELQEPVPAPALLLVVVERVIDLGGDPPHDPPVAPGEEVLGFAVAEERVQPAVQEHPTLELRQGNPQRVVSMQPERQVDEGFQVRPAGDRCDLDARSLRHAH